MVRISIDILFIISMITILSAILLFITLFSYVKHKNKKLLFISSVFLFLFIRGVILSFGLFNDDLQNITSSSYIWIFDLIILIFLYTAYSVKR